VDVDRGADGSWLVGISGADRPVALRHTASPRVSLSLLASASGDLEVTLGGATHRSRIDLSSPPSAPPYGLTFSGGPAPDACAVVWLEIPFPMLAPPKARTP
jgi:hypothetical protein